MNLKLYMKVENVYQDNEGNWHIDYGYTHLMGLAIRVFFGQLLIGFTFYLPFLILAALVGFTFGKSLPAENDSSFQNFQQEFVRYKGDRT